MSVDGWGGPPMGWDEIVAGTSQVVVEFRCAGTKRRCGNVIGAVHKTSHGLILWTSEKLPAPSSAAQRAYVARGRPPAPTAAVVVNIADLDAPVTLSCPDHRPATMSPDELRNLVTTRKSSQESISVSPGA